MNSQASKLERRTVVDPVVMFDGENVFATKRSITSYSDVRDTAIGPVDFGWTMIGAPSLAVGETFTLDVTVNPPWWAFWRTPVVERRAFTVAASAYA